MSLLLRNATLPPKRPERNFQPLGTLGDVGNVELENVVPLDCVGVAGENFGAEGFEKFALGVVGEVLQLDDFFAAPARNSDGDYPVARAGRRRKAAALADNFDVKLHAAQV